MVFDCNESNGLAMCADADLKGMDMHCTYKGVSIKDTWKKPVIPLDPKEGKNYSDLLWNLFNWTIVSSNFILLTQNITKEAVEYLDVDIVDTVRHTVCTDYKVANVIDVIDALDMERSVYTIQEYEQQKILGVHVYVLKRDKLKGHEIFRLSGDTKPIFVSENIRRVVLDNSLTGFEFWPVKAVNSTKMH